MSRRSKPSGLAREQGTVYTLHLDPPYKHAKHYTGWAKDLDARLAEHEAGRGARLTQVQREAGGTWRLARAEPGTRDREAQLKERGRSRDCPICQEEAGRVVKPWPSVPEPRSPPEHMPWAWPGKPDLEAEASGYREYQPLVDRLERQWQQPARHQEQDLELEAG